MATHWSNKPGINHVGEFQVSGHTFVVTGSGDIIKLKFVASSVTLANGNASTNKNFTVYNSDHEAHAFTVPKHSTATYKGKFLTFMLEDSSLDALVEITNIPSASYLPPSGSQLHYIVD